MGCKALPNRYQNPLDFETHSGYPNGRRWVKHMSDLGELVLLIEVGLIALVALMGMLHR